MEADRSFDGEKVEKNDAGEAFTLRPGMKIVLLTAFMGEQRERESPALYSR